jgi:hypothetical protein
VYEGTKWSSASGPEQRLKEDEYAKNVLGDTVGQRSWHPSLAGHPEPVRFQPLHSLPDHHSMRLSSPDKQDCSIFLDGTFDEFASAFQERYSLFEVDQVDVGSFRMDVRDVGWREGGWNVTEMSGGSRELGEEVGVGVRRG